MSASEERLARNEALFRELNERLEDLAGGGVVDLDRMRFVCECGKARERECAPN